MKERERDTHRKEPNSLVSNDRNKIGTYAWGLLESRLKQTNLTNLIHLWFIFFKAEVQVQIWESIQWKPRIVHGKVEAKEIIKSNMYAILWLPWINYWAKPSASLT